jgi:hypothetical protein
VIDVDIGTPVPASTSGVEVDVVLVLVFALLLINAAREIATINDGDSTRSSEWITAAMNMSGEAEAEAEAEVEVEVDAADDDDEIDVKCVMYAVQSVRVGLDAIVTDIRGVLEVEVNLVDVNGLVNIRGSLLSTALPIFIPPPPSPPILLTPLSPLLASIRGCNAAATV